MKSKYRYGRPHDIVRDFSDLRKQTVRTELVIRQRGAPDWTFFAGSYLGGWTDDTVGIPGKYRVISDRNELKVIGRVVSSGSSGNSSLFQFAAGIVTSEQYSSIVILHATNTFALNTSTPRLQIDSTGLLQFFSLPAGTTIVSFHATFSTDA